MTTYNPKTSPEVVSAVRRSPVHRRIRSHRRMGDEIFRWASEVLP